MARPKELDEDRALQRSMTTENATISEILDRGAPARDRLRAVLDQAADAPDTEPAGCLVVDSTVELAPHDTAVRARLRADQDRSLAALTATITDGQRAGEITTDRPARDLARFLTATISGMRVAAERALRAARPLHPGVVDLRPGSSELMLAGLLTDLAADLGVSIPPADLVISGFALGMPVGAPVLAVVTLCLPRCDTLLVFLAVLVAAHIVGALTGEYRMLFGTRVVSAFVDAGFWAIAAASPVPADLRGRAMSIVSRPAGGARCSREHRARLSPGSRDRAVPSDRPSAPRTG